MSGAQQVYVGTIRAIQQSEQLVQLELVRKLPWIVGGLSSSVPLSKDPYVPSNLPDQRVSCVWHLYWKGNSKEVLPSNITQLSFITLHAILVLVSWQEVVTHLCYCAILHWTHVKLPCGSRVIRRYMSWWINVVYDTMALCGNTWY